MGDQFVLPAIAAVVLGGTSMFGGRGGYGGTVAAVIFTTHPVDRAGHRQHLGRRAQHHLRRRRSSRPSSRSACCAREDRETEGQRYGQTQDRRRASSPLGSRPRLRLSLAAGQAAGRRHARRSGADRQRPICRPTICADSAGYDVVKSVHIEAVPSDPLAGDALADRTARRQHPQRHCRLTPMLNAPDVEKTARRAGSFANVRGVRQIVNWHPNPRCHLHAARPSRRQRLAGGLRGCSRNTT